MLAREGVGVVVEVEDRDQAGEDVAEELRREGRDGGGTGRRQGRIRWSLWLLWRVEILSVRILKRASSEVMLRRGDVGEGIDGKRSRTRRIEDGWGWRQLFPP